MKYSIVFTASADKQLSKISPSAQRIILEKLKKLDVNKQNNNVKKLIGSDFYRLRVSDYRVIYQVKHDKLVVLVLKIGHRKDVYNN